MVLSWQTWHWSCFRNYFENTYVHLFLYIIVINWRPVFIYYNLMAWWKPECADLVARIRLQLQLQAQQCTTMKIRNHRIVQYWPGFDIGQSESHMIILQEFLARPHENCQKVLTPTCWHSLATASKPKWFWPLATLECPPSGATCAKLVSDLMSLKCRFVCAEITRIVRHSHLWKHRKNLSDENSNNYPPFQGKLPFFSKGFHHLHPALWNVRTRRRTMPLYWLGIIPWPLLVACKDQTGRPYREAPPIKAQLVWPKDRTDISAEQLSQPPVARSPPGILNLSPMDIWDATWTKCSKPAMFCSVIVDSWKLGRD